MIDLVWEIAKLMRDNDNRFRYGNNLPALRVEDCVPHARQLIKDSGYIPNDGTWVKLDEEQTPPKNMYLSGR